MDTVRVMVFYDGNYFKQGNIFFTLFRGAWLVQPA